MKVGLTLPQRSEDNAALAWPAMQTLAKLVEDGGAESLWLADHFLYRNESTEMGLHEAFTMLTAVAAVTTNVHVGPLVAATSFRSPGMLAKVAATLATVSGGRLILGLGCGWHEPEYQAFGYPFDHRVGRFEEIVPAVQSLLRGERVTVDGQWIQLDDAVILPPPQYAIPLLIAASGPRMLRITAAYADAWQAAWFGRPTDEFRSERAALLEACQTAGRAKEIEIFAGIDVNDEDADNPHLPIDATAIAEALAEWAAEGVDHVQLRVHPGTAATFEIALEGIHRFRG